MEKPQFKSVESIKKEHIELIKRQPKFKIGDKIIHKEYKTITTIVFISETMYILMFGDNTETTIDFKWVERNCRKLTKLEKALK